MTGLTKYFPSAIGSLMDLDAMFSNIFEDLDYMGTGMETYPQFLVQENNEVVLMEFDVPGIPQKDLKIEVQDGVLTVSGERKPQELSGAVKRGGVRSGLFRKSFSLPDSMDSSKIEAKCENGVLSLTIPKRTPKRAEIINIKVSS